MTDEERPEREAELALAAAAESLAEQLTALDEAIAYHERRAAELKDTRRRVKQVARIVSGPPAGKPGPKSDNGRVSEEARAKIAAATARRHAEERAAKKNRVAEAALRRGPGVDISGVDLLAELNEGVKPNDPKLMVGRQLVVELCRELRDDGILRLDRTANGGKAIYRLVGHRE